MATAIKKCRVCGKKYEACRTAKRVDGVFRWQDVACSPECGSIYLSRINMSRGNINDDFKTDNSTSTLNAGANYPEMFPLSKSDEMQEKELSEYFDDDME